MTNKILTKLIAFITVATLSLSVLTACTLPTNKADDDAKAAKHVDALELLADGKYEDSLAIFETLGDYKDAKEHLANFYYMPVKVTFDLVGKSGWIEVLRNEDQLPVLEVSHREDVNRTLEFAYDEEGRILKQTLTENGIVSYFEYTYGENGKQATANYYSETGERYLYVFVYDEEGRDFKWVFTTYDGNLEEYNYTYNEKGDKVVEEYLTNGEGYALYIDIEYDENGNKVKETCTYPDGSSDTIDYFYDEDGRMIKHVYHYRGVEDHVYDYTYDENDNLIKKTHTAPDGTVEYLEIEYVLVYVPGGLNEQTKKYLEDYWTSAL
jgi:YD repeat-containing protein